jgi:hypothetical protein
LLVSRVSLACSFLHSAISFPANSLNKERRLQKKKSEEDYNEENKYWEKGKGERECKNLDIQDKAFKVWGRIRKST